MERARSQSWLLKFCCSSIVILPICTVGMKLAASGSFSQHIPKLSWRNSSTDSCYYPDHPTQRIKCFDLVLSLCSFKTSQRICWWYLEENIYPGQRLYLICLDLSEGQMKSLGANKFLSFGYKCKRKFQDVITSCQILKCLCLSFAVQYWSCKHSRVVCFYMYQWEEANQDLSVFGLQFKII